MDSAEETSSFKERGAKIEDALSGKSLRSGLLSRVARLGQATLPLKGAVVADLTDSEVNVNLIIFCSHRYLNVERFREVT